MRSPYFVKTPPQNRGGQGVPSSKGPAMEAPMATTTTDDLPPPSTLREVRWVSGGDAGLGPHPDDKPLSQQRYKSGW
jgi:hypothetical protein